MIFAIEPLDRGASNLTHAALKGTRLPLRSESPEYSVSRFSYWWLGIAVGLVTTAVMFVADSFPDEVRGEKQEMPTPARTEIDR